MSNKDSGPAEFFYPPATKEAAEQYHELARLALTSIPEISARSSKYSTLLVMNAAVESAYRGIQDARPSSMDPEDSRILRLTARNLANYASTIDPEIVTDETLGGALSYTWDLLDRMLRKLSVASSKPLDQHSVSGKGGAEDPNSDFAKGFLKSLKSNEGAGMHVSASFIVCPMQLHK
jgi:hypothetical protein